MKCGLKDSRFMDQVITSRNHLAVKRARKLKRRSYRDQEGLFLVEGLNLLSEAVRSDVVLRELMYVDSRTEEAHLIAEQAPEIINSYKVSEDLMDLVSDVVTHQGIVGVLEQVDKSYEDFKLRDGPSLLLVADQVRDPGNLGALMRIADCAGADGFLLTQGCVDAYNPKVVRSAAGSHFRVPFVRDMDIDAFANDISVQGMHLWGLDPHSGNSYLDVDYREPTALIVGNEGSGLEEESRLLVEGTVQINMPGKAESLNVASAAAVVLFEVLRQRGNDAGGG
jgi:TrmH family RNA methyltransferase